MADHVGTFYGYRERPLPTPPITAFGRVMLPLWEWFGKVPHENDTFQGDAPDAYGDMIPFDQSEIVLLQVWKNKAVFKLSADGAEYEDEITLDPEKSLGSWLHRYSARGFAVRNETPGETANYQVVIFR